MKQQSKVPSGGGPNEPSIGVIIPTFNRANTLMLCLKHLEEQDFKDFEVIVVDDGSTDDTVRLMQEYLAKSPLQIKYFRQINSGPARARNVGIAELKSQVCLMIGDDILASPRLVSSHLRLHEKRPDLAVAALGLTEWSESRQTVTKFMRWLDESGVQFDYRALRKGAHPDWKHFYTSNLSLKTERLRRFPFDEGFKKAATEDLELGYRLEKEIGLELVFLPEAVAEHVHPTSFRQACQRMITVGESARRFHERWPALKNPSRGPVGVLLRALVLKNPWLLTPIAVICDYITRFWCPNPFMQFALNVHKSKGYWYQSGK